MRIDVAYLIYRLLSFEKYVILLQIYKRKINRCFYGTLKSHVVNYPYLFSRLCMIAPTAWSVLLNYFYRVLDSSEPICFCQNIEFIIHDDELAHLWIINTQAPEHKAFIVPAPTCFINIYYDNIFRFRRGFKQFFSCCPCVEVGPETLTRREVLTSRYSCSGSPDHHRIIRNG